MSTIQGWSDVRVSCVTSYHLHLITRVQDYPLEGKLFNNICSSKSRIARLSPSSKVSKASLEGTPRERRGRWGPLECSAPPASGWLVLASSSQHRADRTQPRPGCSAGETLGDKRKISKKTKPRTCGQLARVSCSNLCKG